MTLQVVIKARVKVSAEVLYTSNTRARPVIHLKNKNKNKTKKQKQKTKTKKQNKTKQKKKRRR